MQIKEMTTVLEVGALSFKFDYRGGRLVVSCDNIGGDAVLALMQEMGEQMKNYQPATVQPEKTRRQRPKPEAAAEKLEREVKQEVEQAAQPPNGHSNGHHHETEPSNGADNVTHLPTPEERKASEEPVCEELDVVQAEDAAKKSQETGDVPERLKGAERLKDVLMYFHEEHKLSSTNDLVDACKKWRPMVPVLQRIAENALEQRVQGAAQTLGLGA